jgi:hypothetical protein
VLVATQELADLDRAAPGLRDQVLGVTALKIVHRQEVPHSARTIAQMIGTERVWEHTRQTAGRLFGGYDTGRGTRSQVERFVVHPNEIQSLRTGDAVVISNLGRQRVQRVRVDPPRPVGSGRPEPPAATPAPTAPSRRNEHLRAARPRTALRHQPQPQRPPPTDSLGR